jgi:hypothetical protein
MNDKVKATINRILEQFETGDIPEVVSYVMFPIPDIPSARWSLLNRTLMFLAGTADARGYKQWRQVNRQVVKGAKALHILVPYIRKVADDSTGEEKESLVGFMARAVFRIEDTAGEPLEYQSIELPTLPFMERAEEWGLSVKAIPGNYRYHGYYRPDRKEIALATPEEKTFFHELAHYAHGRVKGGLRGGQDPLQEIVAELSAQALHQIAGKRDRDLMGNSFQYIRRYAEKLQMTPHKACLRVMADTEKVLNLILYGDGIMKKVA